MIWNGGYFRSIRFQISIFDHINWNISQAVLFHFIANLSNTVVAVLNVFALNPLAFVVHLI